MSTSLQCGRCGVVFAVPPAAHGQSFVCPRCGAATGTPFGPPPQVALPNFAPQSPPPASAAWGAPPAPLSSSRLGWIILSLAGCVVLGVVGCAGVVWWSVERFLHPPQLTQYSSLAEARRGFQTQLIRQERMNEPVEEPPAGELVLETYDSPAGPLSAYLTPPPSDGKRHAAVIWVFGGFSNSISSTAWAPAALDNDQSARQFRESGIVMMYPSFRGGNSNSGVMEGLYGEVDDLLAAADHLAQKDYVDPRKIYLGGHSTGGTLVMLAAATTDRFRAVFALGPVDNVIGYGQEMLPFDVSNERERSLRNPGQWLHAMRLPVFVIEGRDGKVSCLRAMRKASTNPQLQFLEVPGDHFNIIGPVNAMLTKQILEDTGAACNIKLSAP
ncbi:MAG: alpha/beta fold hydrolase [Pirellulales bacterium]